MTANEIDIYVDQAIQILSALGVPLADETLRRKKRIAKAFMAVCGVKPGVGWGSARCIEDGYALLSRQVLKYMNEHLGENIADSSYDDIRRKDLVKVVAAGVILKAAKNTSASTNDGTRKYALSVEAARAVREYGASAWEASCLDFLNEKGALAERLDTERAMAMVPVVFAHGTTIVFSSGEHNQLQKAIIEEFLPLFGCGAEVLYVGDTAKKYLYLDQSRLDELGFGKLAHEALPDVLAYSSKKKWLFLIEAVHSANPISEMRKLALKELTRHLSVGLVYVTAFLDRAGFRKFCKDIAWETEVWIASDPTHMIHFNGDRFLGPHED